MARKTAGRGRQAFWLTVAAFAWSCGLVGAALVLPAYSSVSTSSAGRTSSSSLTLVQQNGAGVLALVAITAVVVAVVWVALHHKCTRGGRLGGWVAWTLVGVLVASCLLGAASIGVVLVPVAAFLARAAAITPSGGSAGGAPTGAPA